jgi:Periplasmic copper-binding protein (NosD)
MNWGIVAALGDSKPGTHLGGIAITRNYIHDFDQYYVCSAWHRDGIFVFSRPDDGTLTIDDVEIAENYLEDNTSAFGSTAWIYVEYVCQNFNIHHNVLNQSRSYYGIRILGDGFQVQGNHMIANNVIANANGMGSAGMHIMQSSGAQIFDNIFYDDQQGYMIATDSMQGAAGDYNLFFSTTNFSDVVILNAGPAESPGSGNAMSLDLMGLQAQGFEKHGLYGDPLWSAPFATIHDDATAFEPEKGSPAIGNGELLSYTVDYLGNPIQNGKPPDIGAFQE